MSADPAIDGLTDFEEIGRGGSARVYKARQTDLERWVAVKVLHSAWDEGVQRRFERERRAMGRLSEHPGIVQVHFTGQTERGEPFIVMPLHAAGSLAERVNRGEPMPWREAMSLMEAVTATMRDAHSEGIIHRDLKPANILIGANGQPRIADFGISRLEGGETTSQATALSFTPAYAPPESFQTMSATPSVDVYGLGATLFGLLAGRAPFSGEGLGSDVLSVINRVAHEEVDDLRPEVPDAICALIERAMRKLPDERPADAGVFLLELRAARAAAEGGEPAATIVGAQGAVFPVPQIDDDATPVGEAVAEPAESGRSRSVSRGRGRFLMPALVGMLVALAGVAAYGLLRDGESDAQAGAQVGGIQQLPSGRQVAAEAPEVFGFTVLDLTDTTARVLYSGTACSGTVYAVAGDNVGASGYPEEDRCWDQHVLLLGRAPFSSGLLEPNTEYTVTVSVTDELGRQSDDYALTFRTAEGTPEDQPPEIQNLSVVDITGSTADISFSTDLCAGSQFFLNGVQLHADGFTDNSNCWNQHSFPFGERSDKLEPNTSYTATVIAVSRFGAVTEAERSFTTAAE